jgi:hypothetical protein
MKKFLYFATGGGADGPSEAYCAANDSIAGLVPTLTTTTDMFIRKIGGVDNTESLDKIVFTHDNTTNTTGHRVKDIAKAIAECANAGPHIDGMTDVIDLDNLIYYSNLSFITGVAITLDV